MLGSPVFWFFFPPLASSDALCGAIFGWHKNSSSGNNSSSSSSNHHNNVFILAGELVVPFG